MRKFLQVVLLITISSLLTSCFDIVEEISLNDDGSGSMMITVNLSKSKTKLASIMLMDSIKGHKVPHENDIRKALQKAVDYLDEAEGISNVKETLDFDNYIFTLSCDFNRVQNINEVLREVTTDLKVKPFLTNFSYDRGSKTFSRENTFDSSAKTKFKDLESEDKEIFSDSFYTCVYRFQSQVINQSNNNARLSKSKKAVMLRANAQDVINGNVNLSNTITLD